MDKIKINDLESFIINDVLKEVKQRKKRRKQERKNKNGKGINTWRSFGRD